MRVLVLGSFDSFLNAGKRCAELLQSEGATIEYALVRVRRNQLSEVQKRQIGLPDGLKERALESIVTRAELSRYDVLFLGLDGNRTRKFMVAFKKTFCNASRRPITVAFYPGLIFRFHLEGMMSRMSCDLVLLNSESDLELYRRLLSDLSVDCDNGVCAGLASVSSRRQSAKLGSAIVFIGQPTVPAGRVERAFVVQQLLALAEKFPDAPIVLKPRHRRNESTLHRTMFHYEDLLDDLLAGRPAPSNFSVSHDPVQHVLNGARLCVTISSTVGLDALARRIPTRVITDLGMNENLGNHFFSGSGILCDFASLNPEMPYLLNEPWYSRNVASLEEQRGHLVAAIRRTLETPADTFSRGLGDAVFLGRSQNFTAFAQARYGEGSVPTYGTAQPVKRVRGWFRRLVAAKIFKKKAFGRDATKPVRRADIDVRPSIET